MTYNDYGTTGIDTPAVSSRNSILAGNAAKEPTLSEMLIKDADAITEVLRDVLSDQNGLIGRMFGQISEDPEGANKADGGGGLAGGIHQRMQTIRVLALKARDNQAILRKIG